MDILLSDMAGRACLPCINATIDGRDVATVAGLYSAPAGYQVKDQNDHRNDQQDVNQAATNVTNKSQQPKDQQYH